MRLACIYALLDDSFIIRRVHLEAALALWHYCEDSAKFVFGDSLGDRDADRLVAALAAAPGGLSRTEIGNDVFHKHKQRHEITALLSRLLGHNLVHRTVEASTGGRPAERWHAGRAPK
jgi:hypothetical protein